MPKYNTHLSDADIQARVADLIEKKVPENNTEEVKKFLFTCIDLTTLNSTDSDESVMRFTEKVNQFDDEFPDLKNVAAICVYPNFAAIEYAGGRRSEYRLCIRRISFFSNIYRSKSSGNCTGHCRRRRRNRYCNLHRQVPEWRLRSNV